MRKRLIRQDVRGSSTMATMLLMVFSVPRLSLLLVVTSAMSGCIPWGDDSVLPQLPSKKNTPPRILLNSIVPNQQQSTIRVGTYGAGCIKPSFSVQVTDEDSVRLNVKWFVDPKPDHSQTAESPVVSDTPPPTSVATRDIVAPPALLGYLTNLTDGQSHRVEVIVTDGIFDPESPANIINVEPYVDDTNDAGFQTAYKDNFLWDITVDRCP